MDALEGIFSRRSVRRFAHRTVDRDLILEIIRAGMWAPSGLNNQPWRFAVVSERELRGELAGLTKYSSIIEEAPVSIGVFVDRTAMYHEVKDHQAMGACIQNMLLAAHALGLGAVWLGEILKNGSRVRDLLRLPETLDLMAVLAVGHPAAGGTKPPRRRELHEVLLAER